MTSTVKTVNIIDPRIEPQPDPLYSRMISPRQNQYYKIPASACSNSYLAFNNLTTLGVDRAYLDTFEIEVHVKIEFTGDANNAYKPEPDEWTFDSFPLAKCCDDARVNINGGAFFSSPLSYVRAKERYWCEKAISDSYENVCPCHKPYLQYETGQVFNGTSTNTTELGISQNLNNEEYTYASSTLTKHPGSAIPTRLAAAQQHYNITPAGLSSGTNNTIVKVTKHSWDTNHRVLTVEAVWREPVFCSPFSSRIDATYGRPLYNITSMDLAFNLQSLENMIRVCHLRGEHYVNTYKVTLLNKTSLCYQVMTIPSTLNKPLTTLVPYRRFVPYVTNTANQALTVGGTNVFHSSNYTLNEIPQAIWLFVAPLKATYQTNDPDDAGTDAATNMAKHGNWTSNKAFAFIDHISLNLANTTQILNTAEKIDLYRIAKANGCCDSYENWGLNDVVDAKRGFDSTTHLPQYKSEGIGSVLRLIVGTDIIIPDQELIPGTNANNMVFSAEVKCTLPRSISPNQISKGYGLWMLFEYVGVAAISPGQCEITMNPLGSGEIFTASPVVSVPSNIVDGTEVDGGGFFGKLGNFFRNAYGKIKPIVNNVQSWLQSDKGRAVTDAVLNAASESQYEPVRKAANLGNKFLPRGGAVLGLGDFT